ncbi:MAG: CehA/McbA family metallohydrolase [Rhodospirillales bacterium]|nr:CehA/McbA family metallohydrolase [Rhodospirillales bacterium]
MKNLPFGRPGQFYRGNLHTHSTNSDGKLAPGEVCNAYREAGYDFISLTEHFIEHFDFPVTDTRAYRSNDFTTLIAAELHQGTLANSEPWHILAVGIPLDFARPGKDEGPVEIAERAAATGAFIGIVHPSWYGLTIEDARLITCAHAIEIYNHGSEIEVDRGEDWPFCDLLLNEGWRLSGYATDDAHHITHDAFGGWMHVLADSLEPDALLDSMKAGRYYSSQGPQIHDIKIADGELHVACSPAHVISLQGRGARSTYKMGDGIEEATFPTDRFEDAYVRVTIRDANGKRAWSNPIWFD